MKRAMNFVPPVKREPRKLPDGCIAIPLTGGNEAVVSPEDAVLASANWYAKRSRPGSPVYAVANVVDNGRKRTVRMHNVIRHRMGLVSDETERVDHRDGDGLNNRRSNLRPADATEQNMNKRCQSNNLSGYKGVKFDRQRNKWHARIAVGELRIGLGHHDSSLAAALAYDRAARAHFGQFARTNYPAFAAGG